MANPQKGEAEIVANCSCLCLRNTMYMLCLRFTLYIMMQRKTAKLAHSPLQMNRGKHMYHNVKTTCLLIIKVVDLQN